MVAAEDQLCLPNDRRAGAAPLVLRRAEAVAVGSSLPSMGARGQARRDWLAAALAAAAALLIQVPKAELLEHRTSDGALAVGAVTGTVLRNPSVGARGLGYGEQGGPSAGVSLTDGAAEARQPAGVPAPTRAIPARPHSQGRGAAEPPRSAGSVPGVESQPRIPGLNALTASPQGRGGAGAGNVSGSGARAGSEASPSAARGGPALELPVSRRLAVIDEAPAGHGVVSGVYPQTGASEVPGARSLAPGIERLPLPVRAYAARFLNVLEQGLGDD